MIYFLSPVLLLRHQNKATMPLFFKANHLIVLILGFGFVTSCNKQPDEPKPGIPSTYSFDDVSFDGQLTRQAMLSELSTLLKTGATQALDQATLLNMFSGTGYTAESLNSSGKQLENKTTAFFIEEAKESLKEAAGVSSTLDTATATSAGIVYGATRTIAVDAKGFEFAQVIEKGLMSATFMDQALNNYLNDIQLDNNTSDSFVAGEGTQMAHHWDEAYGYFTDSKNFPSEGILRFWGRYSNNRNSLIGTNESIGGAFRTGRQAILDNQIDVVIAQAEIIKQEWTKLAAANFIHYINTTKANFTDEAEKLHALSEAYGFLIGVKIGGGSVNDILSDFMTKGLHALTEDDLTLYANRLAIAYNLVPIQSSL